MRQLTLEEEEEVQQRCEEKSPSEAMEDPGPGGSHADPTDSKTLQGTALGWKVCSPGERLMCTALLLTRPLAGRETALALVREGAQRFGLTLESFPRVTFPRASRCGPAAQLARVSLALDFSVREVLLLGWMGP